MVFKRLDGVVEGPKTLATGCVHVSATIEDVMGQDIDRPVAL
jgi:hypothetical protein